MLNGLKQYLFLVVDQETKGILTKCPSANTANVIANGITNCSRMTIHFPWWSGHDISKYTENEKINYKLVRQINFNSGPSGMMDSEINVCEIVNKTKSGKIFDLEPMDSKNITDSWLEKRKLANFRSEKIAGFEVFCERYISRIKTFCGDELFFHALKDELELVDDANEVYPAGIVEWANINEVSPSAAYYELKMSYDSMRITLIRIHALWRKYSIIINNMNSEDEFRDFEFYTKIESEFRFGKR